METSFHAGARGGYAEDAARDLAALARSEGSGGLTSDLALLERVFALQPAGFLRHMPGRETFSWPDPARLVIKRYRGGEARDWWYGRLRGAPRSPARREWENLVSLARQGLSVPRAIAWVEEPEALCRRGGGRSGVVMEYVAHEGSLRDHLARCSPGERRGLGRTLAALVATLHDSGWYHRDLYLHQIAVRPCGELILFDVGRARCERAPRRRWQVKDLAALLSSVPAEVTRGDTLRWLDCYLQSRRLPAGERRTWARAVVRRAARMTAHVPRHVDPDSVT